MKFIPPMEIASRVMTLIDLADQSLVLVTPYLDISGWDKMKSRLKKAVERDVSITLYLRQNTNNNLLPLKELGIKPIFIKDLHAKLYLNEKSAIVSSQNITYYSEKNSIDLGYETETTEEKEELEMFIKRYLKNEKSIQPSIAKIEKVEKPEMAPHPESLDSEVVTPKFFLKEHEIKKLEEIFKQMFPALKIKSNGDATYVYCTRLLPFADVMFREGYEIRFRYNMEDTEAVMTVLNNLDLNRLNYRYTNHLRGNLAQPKELLLIPNEVNDIEKLVADYLNITRNILQSNL